MGLPFTTEQFLGVFEDYHRAVGPMPVVLTGLAVAAVALAARKTSYSAPAVAGILGVLWLWMGLVYHLVFFTAINPAAYAFGLLTAAQGLLFLYAGPVRSRLSFHLRWDAYGLVGFLLLVYALVVYPALGYALGHHYPRTPTFGLPCPTTIFTFGLLLWTDRPVPKYLLPIPAVWAVVGSVAAVALGVPQDYGLAVAGLVGVVGVVLRGRAGVTPDDAVGR